MVPLSGPVLLGAFLGISYLLRLIITYIITDDYRGTE